MITIKVTRSWRTYYQRGLVIDPWPDEVPRPRLHEMVCVFDRALDFTQHQVLRVRPQIVLGQALPWRHPERRPGSNPSLPPNAPEAPGVGQAPE
jgi:hypothetical protein